MSEIKKQDISIIVIGASTGGPDAVSKVISSIKVKKNVVILITQHMPVNFTNRFANRLNSLTDMIVTEAVNGEFIKGGHVYVAKGGYHMEVSKGRIVLNEDPPMHGVRPAVDKLFLSVAKEYKDKVLAVILTGMGKDGAEGIKSIKANGGITMAQDEKTSVIYGMPKAAKLTGAVDYEVALSDIGTAISNIINV